MSRSGWTQDQIRNELASRGFELLSEYQGSSKKLTVRCSKGHEWTTLWGTIRDGHACSRCAGKYNYTHEEIVSLTAQRGFSIVSGVYERCSSLLLLQCQEGHTWKSSWNRIQTGDGCPFCSGCAVDTKQVKAIVSSRSFKLVGPYQGRHAPIQLECPLGHAWAPDWGNFVRGAECPHCQERGTSLPERELMTFLQTFYSGDIKANYHVPLSEPGKRYMELDLYLPDLRLAIEYNGLIWHSTRFSKDAATKHLDKLERCSRAGIRLIQIFEDEWKKRPEACKLRLQYFLGKAERIGARKCSVVTLSTTEANRFCDDYHVQGKGKTKIAFGLTNGASLIAVMTFAPTTIAKGGNGSVWELTRFCSNGVAIAGGATRLFNAFLATQAPSQVISYCDRRWGTGGVYLQLGMTPVGNTKPNYYYVTGDAKLRRLHRFNFRKDVLVRKHGGDPLKTERELTEEMGWWRIYDCGHFKFVWTPRAGIEPATNCVRSSRSTN